MKMCTLYSIPTLVYATTHTMELVNHSLLHICNIIHYFALNKIKGFELISTSKCVLNVFCPTIDIT